MRTMKVIEWLLWLAAGACLALAAPAVWHQTLGKAARLAEAEALLASTRGGGMARGDSTGVVVRDVDLNGFDGGLDGGLDAALPPEPALPVPAADGQALGVLRIPDLDMTVPVVAGESAAALDRGAGWLPDTAVPGARRGNLGLAAHRDSFFRPLRDVAVGQEVVLDTLHGEQRYRVTWTRVTEPTDVAVLDPTPHGALTLVTCYPFDFIGPAPQRFIVRADRVDQPAADSAGSSTLLASAGK